MERDQVVKQIVTTLAVVLDEDVADVTEQTRLAEELALDSMSVLQLLMQLEDDLAMEIDMDELLPEVLQTVGSLADHLQQASSQDRGEAAR